MPDDARKSLPPKNNSKHRNSRLSLPLSRLSSIESSSGADEDKQAGPVVPSRPGKRLSVKEGASIANAKVGSASKRPSAMPTSPVPCSTRPGSTLVARVVELEVANEALRNQLKEKDAQVVTLKASASRAATAEASSRRQKVELEKLKDDNKELQEELEKRSHKVDGLNKRINDLSKRLIHADKKAKQAERIPQLEEQVKNLTTKLDTATAQTASSSKQPNDEITELRELANSRAALITANSEYIKELEEANRVICLQYSALAADMAAKDSEIDDLQHDLEALEDKHEELQKSQKPCEEPSTDAFVIEELRKSLGEAEREARQTTSDALNGLGRFKHLKPKTSPRLTMVTVAGVEIKPLEAASMDRAPPHSPVHTANTPPSAPPPAVPSPPAILSQHLHVAIHIGTPTLPKLPILRRIRSILTKESTISIDAPPGIEPQIRKAIEATEADYAAQRAKVSELSEIMFAQEQRIEWLEKEAERKMYEREGKCMVGAHRTLADTVRALEERVEMQAMMLAGPPKAWIPAVAVR